MKVIWNDIVVADSDHTIKIEGDHYFPPNSVKKEFLEDSTLHTTNAEIGEASYYHVQVNGQVNVDAAWYYPDPKDKAKEIKNYIAFKKGVTVQE
jgi:uncharacterized protein (DUF427 family)